MDGWIVVKIVFFFLGLRLLMLCFVVRIRMRKESEKTTRRKDSARESLGISLETSFFFLALASRRRWSKKKVSLQV